MKSKRILLFVLTLFVCSFSVIAQNSPRAAVEAFYRYDRSHSQTFNRRNIDARKRWFSAELYNLFLNELKRDAAYLKKNPTDKPYFGDGLPFQPLQEKCDKGFDRSLAVKQEFARGSRAVATATFAYPKRCGDPMPVVYTIGLIKTHSGWVIDDINYGEDTTLKQRLRRKEY
jgi:hypothetical protein